MKTTSVMLLCALSVGCSSGRRERASDFFHPSNFPGPVEDADPSIRSKRTFRVPTRLTVKRLPKSIEVSWEALAAVELDVGHKMMTGGQYQVFIVSEDKRRPCRGGLGGARFGSTVTLSESEVKDRIEVEFTIFETDIPAQHLWQPDSSGRYRVLWTRTLSAKEPGLPNKKPKETDESVP